MSCGGMVYKRQPCAAASTILVDKAAAGKPSEGSPCLADTTPTEEGKRFKPGGACWEQVSVANAPSARSDHAASVWTMADGKQALAIVGGFSTR